jgi:uncharacterized iron-regulated membrane protein
MSFVRFLMDSPIVAFLLLLALFVTAVPIFVAWLSRGKSAYPDEIDKAPKELPATRFLGNQLDLVALVLVFLLLLVLAGWVRKTFFG